MIEITEQPIDAQRVLSHVAARDAGAVVLFLGTTREHTEGKKTASLDYEAYGDMALAKLRELQNAAVQQWPITRSAIVHRVGHLKPGEPSVAVAISTPHRAEAFEAARWLIDTVKQEVPIWKRENWADGTSDWVHPGVRRTR